MLEELASRFVALATEHPELAHPFEAAIVALEQGRNPVVAFEAAAVVAAHRTAVEAAARAALHQTVKT